MLFLSRDLNDKKKKKKKKWGEEEEKKNKHCYLVREEKFNSAKFLSFAESGCLSSW